MYLLHFLNDLLDFVSFNIKYGKYSNALLWIQIAHVFPFIVRLVIAKFCDNISFLWQNCQT